MRLSLLALAAGTLVAGNAFAAGTSPQSTSFQVSANVIKSCRVSADDLSFTDYDPADAHSSSPLTSSSQIRVRCTKGTTGTVELGLGGNSDAANTCASPARAMAGAGATAGEKLNYQLYSDSPGGTVWGCDANNDVDFSATASNADVTRTVYGSIAANQDVSAGSFADSVTVDVNF